MGDPLNSKSPTLRRTYPLVGVVGAIMLVFILISYFNANRIRKLTSPLWIAVREVKLESTAVQHEASDLLRGEIDPSSDAIWLYLDQSIWHLSNLLNAYQQGRRVWLKPPKTDFGSHAKALNQQLNTIKTFFIKYAKQTPKPIPAAAAIARLDVLFAQFHLQLDEIERGVSRIMDREQLEQDISHAVLVVFGLAMVVAVFYQMRHYDRYRKEIQRTLTTSNDQLKQQIGQKMHAQEALKERERLFRAIFNTCPDGIVLCRLTDDSIVDVNPGFSELTGYSKNEAVNATGVDWLASKGLDLRQAAVSVVESSSPAKNLECRFPGRDDRMRTVLISANTVNFDKERHLVAVARDISDLKSAESELRFSYELMTIANKNRHTGQMLQEFITSIQSHTGCRHCIIRLLDDRNRIYDAASSDSPAVTCTLAADTIQSLGCACADVITRNVDEKNPCFTEFGSFFPDHPRCRSASGGWRSDGPIRCARLDYHSLALVPVRVGQQILGLVQIADDRQGMLSPTIVELMEAAALHMGTAIRRLRAEEGLEKAYMELEKRVLDRTRELSAINRELKAEIEDRRQIENRLRKNRNTLQTVIDGIDDSLILLDREMKIRMLNRVAAKTYDIDSIDTVLGKYCFDEIGTSLECGECEIMHAVERGVPISFERAMGEQNGERLERIAVYPVMVADDQPGGTIIRISDITEEKRFERQLIQSEKMASLGLLVASIGHEINNPNNFISFNIPILREYLERLIRIADEYAQTQPDFELFHMSYSEFREDVFKLVDNIEHGSSRISSFVSNLRDFVEDSGSQEKAWLELSDVLDKVLSICRSQIKKRIRDFRVHIPDDHPRIHADEYSLEQILLNFIVNAIHAADKADSTVSLSVARGESWLESTIITIADNGCGIDEDSQARIFDPFYTTKPAGEGTGLGLYVCHNLVQRLGGRIEVKSVKGEGSTFTIFLPGEDRRATSRARGSLSAALPRQ